MYYVLRIKKAGWRDVSHRAPFLWNNLFAEISKSDSIEAIKSNLKTSFFTLTFNYCLGAKVR